jgi:hypothetical protein
MKEWGTTGNLNKYMEGYRKFYFKDIIPIMRENGIKIEENFMDTSPTGGVKSF